MARPPRGSMYGQPQSNSLLGMLSLLFRAMIAYAVGFWLYVFLYRIVSATREYGVSDPGARSLIFFVLLIILILVLFSPLMQSGESGSIRLLGAMTGFVLLVLALSQAANILPFNPDGNLSDIFRRNFAPWAFNLNIFRR